jgi:hypothetical protein
MAEISSSPDFFLCQNVLHKRHIKQIRINLN